MNNPLAMAASNFMKAFLVVNNITNDCKCGACDSYRRLEEALAKYETHVLVPREPTIQMVIAGRDAKDGWANITPIYKAMIEAAEEKV